MSPKALLPALLVFLTAALGAQSIELKASVNSGLLATFQDGTVAFGSNAENTAVVGQTRVNGTVGVLTAEVVDPNYGATLTVDVGSGAAQVNAAWGWYRPLDWMTIAAGTSNPNPFGSVDNAGAGTFAGPGIAGMIDLAPLQFGGVVASQAGATGTSPNLTLTGGARLTLENIGTLNFIVGTIETIWMDWYHVSVAYTPFPGFALTGGVSSKGITTAYSEEANVGLSFGLIPEVGVSGYVELIDFTLAHRYPAFNASVGWAVTRGVSLVGTVSGDFSQYPNSTGKGALTYQPYEQVIVVFGVSHKTNPGNVAVAVPRTDASVDFTFSL